MIRTEHGVIRTADPDDANAVRRLFPPDRPRAFFLDRRRELTYPTVDEFWQIFNQRDASHLPFYAVEDLAGQVQGFITLRASTSEASFGELVLMFGHEEAYEAPFAEEALQFLCQTAFRERRMNKVVAQCLDTETACRAFLTARGFESDGVQREVLYTQGCWRDLESLSLFSANAAALLPREEAPAR